VATAWPRSTGGGGQSACQTPDDRRPVALWGEVSAEARQTIESIYKELCLFDEHTWGSGDSVAFPTPWTPWASSTRRPDSPTARWLGPSGCYRSACELGWPGGGGLYVANTAPLPFTGWVRMPVTSLRENYCAVEDPQSGQATAILFEAGPRPWTRPESPSQLGPENEAATFPDARPGRLRSSGSRSSKVTPSARYGWARRPSPTTSPPRHPRYRWMRAGGRFPSSGRRCRSRSSCPALATFRRSGYAVSPRAG